MLSVFVGSLVLVGLLVLALVRLGNAGRAAQPGGLVQKPLMLYCAAGVQPVVVEVIEQYAREYGMQVDVSYGGSGTLLGQIEINPTGDLYLAADESYIPLGRNKGLLSEAIPLATQHPVVAVAKGNPKNITSLSDLLRSDVKLGLANPDAASIGRVSRLAFEEAGHWNAVREACKVFKPTVSELANDVRIGSIDAGVIWDSTAAQLDALDVVELPELTRHTYTIKIAVLTACKRPAEALRFARYLAASDRGGKVFDHAGYGSIDRDPWSAPP